MKKVIFIIFFLLAMQYGNCVYAIETNETLKTQEETLNISEFIKESENYTKDTFSDIDLNTIYKSAISGNIDMNGILSIVLKLIGNETLNTIKTLRLHISYHNNT